MRKQTAGSETGPRRGVGTTIRLGALLAATVVFLALAATATASKMYWSDSGNIRKSNLDGTGQAGVLSDVGAGEGFQVDGPGGKMYWSNRADDKIQRANLDGTGVEDVVSGVDTRGFYVDSSGGKIYWTVINEPAGASKIRRANLDGTNVEDLVTGNPLDFRPNTIAVDEVHDKLYWTDNGNVFPTNLPGTISRANLNGSGRQQIFTQPFGFAEIEVDPAGGKIYWADSQKVRRADLNGTNVEDLVTSVTPFPGGPLEDPYAIALDLYAGKVYWTDWKDGTDPGKIQRANLNGTAAEDLVTLPVGLAWGLDLYIRPFSELINSVKQLELRKGLERSLVKKLKNARRNLAADPPLTAEACEKLASFVNQVDAQEGKEIDAADADELIAYAEAIQEAEGCAI